MATRSWQGPPAEGVTLHLVGDVHFGLVGTQTTNKLARVGRDIRDGVIGRVDAHIQTGDLVDGDIPAAEDSEALQWIADYLGDAPVHLTLGNHDIWNNFRDATAWAQAYGLPSQNYTADVGDIRLVVLGPETFMSSPIEEMVLPGDTLRWIDAQLSATSRDCYLFCHWPLWEHFADQPTGFTAWPHDTLAGILADHRNARAWIAGHNHVAISHEELVTTRRVGGRPGFLCVNTSTAGAFSPGTGPTGNLNDRLHSLYLTVLEDQIQVRFRDHGQAAWTVGSPDVRVWTCPLT